MFYGSRVLVLRNLRRLTQSYLADSVSTTQAVISNVEKGKKTLTENLVKRMCLRYRVPIEFFMVEPRVLQSNLYSWKALKKASQADRSFLENLHSEAERAFDIVAEKAGYITWQAAYPGRISEAAEQFRCQLGIATDTPIRNVVRAIERQGIGVLTNFADCKFSGHYGVSRPSLNNSHPLIATLPTEDGARQRSTLLHEVGHLIFDTKRCGVRDRGTDKQIEERADRFAREVMLPPSVLASCVNEKAPLSVFLQLRAEYGISVKELITYARREKLVTDERGKSLYIQHSTRGWNKREPVTVSHEKEMLFGQCVSRACGDVDTFSKETGIGLDEANRWFQIAPGKGRAYENTRNADVITVNFRV